MELASRFILSLSTLEEIGVWSFGLEFLNPICQHLALRVSHFFSKSNGRSIFLGRRPLKP